MYLEESIEKRVLAINDMSHEIGQFLSQERENKEENSTLFNPKTTFSPKKSNFNTTTIHFEVSDHSS